MNADKHRRRTASRSAPAVFLYAVSLIKFCKIQCKRILHIAI